MYGLVNEALKGWLIERHGDSAWNSVRQMVEGVPGSFGAFEQYDDRVTYELVGAVTKTFGHSPEYVLEQFGRYWVLVVAEQSYGDLMVFGGSSFEEFVGNLDALHNRLQSLFLNWSPPSFLLEKEDSGELRLVYISKRQGLEPFVTGLLHGLAERFDNEAEIKFEGHDQVGAVFRIRLQVEAA